MYYYYYYQGLGQRHRHGLRLRPAGAEEGPQAEAHEAGHQPRGQAAPREAGAVLRVRQRPAGSAGVPLLRGRGRNLRPPVPALRRSAGGQRLRGLRPHVEPQTPALGAQGHRDLLRTPVGGPQRDASRVQRGGAHHAAQIRPDLLLDQGKLHGLQRRLSSSGALCFLSVST